MVDNVLRFRRNRIVDDLVMSANLNLIWRDVQLGKYTREEYGELLRLTGYSLSGFGGVFNDDEDDGTVRNPAA